MCEAPDGLAKVGKPSWAHHMRVIGMFKGGTHFSHQSFVLTRWGSTSFYAVRYSTRSCHPVAFPQYGVEQVPDAELFEKSKCSKGTRDGWKCTIDWTGIKDLMTCASSCRPGANPFDRRSSVCPLYGHHGIYLDRGGTGRLT